jgi:hypothetical protein
LAIKPEIPVSRTVSTMAAPRWFQIDLKLAALRR